VGSSVSKERTEPNGDGMDETGAGARLFPHPRMRVMIW